MTFNDLTIEHQNSMTLGYPRRVVEYCATCGQYHDMVVRHAGYGRSRWYEIDGALVDNPPCQYKEATP